MDHLITKQIQDHWTKAQAQNHRFLLTIFGEDRGTLCGHLFHPHSSLSKLLPIGDIITIGAKSSGHVFHELWPSHQHIDLSWSVSKVRLGGTESALLIDLSEGCDPNALGACLGSISGRGLVVILAPLNFHFQETIRVYLCNL